MSSIRLKGGAREANCSGLWYNELEKRIEVFIEGARTGYFDVSNGWTFEDPVTMEETLAVTGASTLTGNVAAAGTLAVTGVTTVAGGIAAGGVARTALAEDALAVFDLPIRNWMAEDGAVLGIAEEAGTFFVQDGTNQMYLQGEVSNNETEVSVMKTSFTLPENYVDGATINIRAVVDVTGAGTLGTCTVDFSVFKQDNDGAIGSDLVTTSATAVTADSGAKDFVVTPTGIVSGDVLSIKLTTSIQETAATAIQAIITKTQMLLDVKG